MRYEQRAVYNDILGVRNESDSLSEGKGQRFRLRTEHEKSYLPIGSPDVSVAGQRWRTSRRVRESLIPPEQ